MLIAYWRAIGVVAAATLAGLALLPSTPPPAIPTVVARAIPVELLDRYIGPPTGTNHDRGDTCCFGPCWHELRNSRDRDDDQLTKGDVIGGMAHIREQVHACQHDGPGIARVEITIGASGRITRARVVGDFENTPTGRCVAKAVRRAQFRATKQPIDITYPFLLR
jgi:hypothetical protein